MKKGYNSTDIQQQDRQDQARRLYRWVSSRDLFTTITLDNTNLGY